MNEASDFFDPMQLAISIYDSCEQSEIKEVNVVNMRNWVSNLTGHQFSSSSL